MGAWGYEEVGEVCELGSQVEKVKLGQIVYGTWGHRESNVVTEEFALEHTLPEDLDPIVRIYSQMGSIALNAVLMPIYMLEKQWLFLDKYQARLLPSWPG